MHVDTDFLGTSIISCKPKSHSMKRIIWITVRDYMKKLDKYVQRYFGDHLGHYLEFWKILKDASPASCRFCIRTTSCNRLCNNLVGGYFCKVKCLAAEQPYYLQYDNNYPNTEHN